MLKTDLMILANRLTLGSLFVLAGVRKLLPAAEKTVLESWSGFASFVASQAPLPEFLGKAYGYALPPVELIAGAMLIVGFKARIAALLIGLMMLSFLIAASQGDWWPAKGPAFPPNLILLTLAMWLFVQGPGKLSLDRKKTSG